MAHVHNGRDPDRQSRSRRAYGSYQFSIERRALAAAGAAKENAWPNRQAAGLFAVNAAYVGLVRQLNESDRLRLARGEVRLAQLYKEHLQCLAERRAQRLAAEREAEMHAARQAELQAIHTCLDQVGLACLVDQIVARFSEAALVDCFDLVLERRGRDLVQAVINLVGAERVRRTLDHATAPMGAMAAE